jgi:galactonate dehydratase
MVGALVTNRFLVEMNQFHTGYLSGQISPEGEDFGVNVIAAMRDAVGPNIGILLDAHGHYNVPTAVRICRRLEPYTIGWLEEPTPPESIQALKAVREQVNVPICVGERLYTRWQFRPVLEQKLTDYIMPDIIRTGGISEMKKIATLAESYFVPISPHDATGPINLIAGAQTMLATSSFFRLEVSYAQLALYQQIMDPPFEVHHGHFYVSERPGLGHEPREEFLARAIPF